MEIFAFESVLYELETGHVPQPSLEDCAVERLYKAGMWPENTKTLVTGQVILTCWDGGYKNMEDVARCLKSLWDDCSSAEQN